MLPWGCLRETSDGCIQFPPKKRVLRSDCCKIGACDGVLSGVPDYAKEGFSIRNTRDAGRGKLNPRIIRSQSIAFVAAVQRHLLLKPAVTRPCLRLEIGRASCRERV